MHQRINSFMVSKGAMNKFREMFPLAVMRPPSPLTCFSALTSTKAEINPPDFVIFCFNLLATLV